MNLLVDYLRLRIAVGALGLLLPFALYAIAGPQESLSAYYHTQARDLFVGVLVAVSCLLLAYRGYDDGDRAASAIAGFSLLCVAMFPVGGETNFLHLVSAVLFFGASAELCRRFAFGGYRVRTFRALAGVIVAAMVAAALGAPLFVAESVAVVAFGVAWLLKGRLFSVSLSG